MPARKDAVQNRERLVQAARLVFAERGLDATLDEIAERAGVGTGTAYRNFADKYELAAEVLADATQQIVDDANAALAIEDPWLSFATFFETTAARQAADRGLYEALAGQGRAADKVRIWPDIVRSVTALFNRAKRAGTVRSDLEPEDAVTILTALGAVDEWQRPLALLLDGARATDSPPLPGTVRRFESLDDMVAASKPGKRRA